LAGGLWPFAAASTRLKQFCHFEVSDEFIRKTCLLVAPKIAQFQAASPTAVASFQKAAGAVEFETDATTVNTIDGWRDMKIGIFAKRQPGDSVDSSRWDDRQLPQHTSRFAFCGIAESTLFASTWASTATRLGVDPLSSKLTILGDGAEWIWNRASEQFPHGQQVLDVYHALQYVSQGAKAIFGDGTAEAKQFTDRGRQLLLSDGYAGVTDWVGEMLGMKVAGGDGASLGGVLNYLKGHSDRTNYALRLHRGQTIGSGMVEGAAKNVSGKRLKANNARWRVNNVCKMGSICTAIYSDCWDGFWPQN
jgi:hypothetical protein